MPDLTTCDQEPITRLDHIQNFGFLVALSNDWTVIRASANLGTHLGIEAISAIGGNFALAVDIGAQAAIRDRMAMLRSTGNERLFGIRLVEGRALFDLNLHFVDDILIIEGEPATGEDTNDAALIVRRMIGQFDKTSVLDAFLRAAARQVREVTGFDRVMVYRIGPGGDGEIVAESNRTGIESLLGVHYPAADIPKQARALYLRNTFRVVSDVSETPVPLLPMVAGNAVPLDLSHSITRALSPIHIEYLTNMGVSATLSISIIVEGKLWGLFTCHHFAPRLPSLVIRTAAELFGGAFSLALESRLARASVATLDSARALTDVAFAKIAANPDLMSAPGWLPNMMRDMFDYDGLAIYRSGDAYCDGSTPVAAAVFAIAQYLNLTSPGHVFTTDHLSSIGTLSAADFANAAGMLAIPISHLPGDYIMLFRHEHLTSINWGGDPAKFSSPKSEASLLPRKSFAPFIETIHGKSRPFSDCDRRIGEAVRSAMVEVILRLSAVSIAALAAEVDARRDVEREVFGLNEQFEAKVADRTRDLIASNGRLAKRIIKGNAALASSRAETEAHQTLLLDSEGSNRVLSVANEELAINEIALEKIVAERTTALRAEINTRRIMATAIAHELNQPLAAICSFLEGMSRLAERGDPSPAMLTKIFDGSRQAVTQAIRAGGILKVLRNSITRDDAVRTEEDIGTIIEDTIALAVADGDGPDVTFTFNGSATGMIATVNRTQIRQVLSNLVQNAVEAVGGTDLREVTITLGRIGTNMLRVEVSDTGPGISAEVAKGLFMPFLSTKPHGMGIGLSISREIIEEHQGKLTTRANPDGGAIFSFSLPLGQLPLAA